MRRAPANSRRLWVVSIAILLFALGFAGSGLASQPFATSFGSGGVGETPLPAEDRQLISELGQGPVISDLAATPGGGLVAAVGSGTENSFFGAARFGARGELDQSFGTSGFVRAKVFPSLVRTTEPQAEAVAVQRDGRLVLVGYRLGIASDTPAPVLMRLLPNGRPDRSFAQKGLIAPKPNGARADVLHAVAVQPGGRIVAVGTRNERDRKAVQVKRPAGLVVAYRPDGSLDRSFGQAGRAFFPGPKSRYSFTGLLDLAVMPNGKIIAVGYRDDQILVVRLRANGRLDSDFAGGDGIFSLDPGRGNLCCPEEASIGALPGGRVIVLADGFGRVLMAGLRANGTLDARFGLRGIVRASGQEESTRALAVQANGRIAIAGQGSRGFTIRRYLPDGKPDRSFGRKGIRFLPRGRASVATSATTLPDGRVVVGGGAQYQRDGHLEYSLLLAKLR